MEVQSGVEGWSARQSANERGDGFRSTKELKRRPPEENLEMLMKRVPDIPSYEITPENLYRNRREFMKAAAAMVATAAATTIVSGCVSSSAASEPLQSKLGPYDTAESVTPYQSATTYN